MRAWAVAGLGLALLGPALVMGQTPSVPATTVVTIENVQFSPQTVSVHRGDRIQWVNKDLFPHTVTATNKAFDSGSIPAGGTWTYVAAKSGEFAYACTFHPTMKGSLTVK